MRYVFLLAFLFLVGIATVSASDKRPELRLDTALAERPKVRTVPTQLIQNEGFEVVGASGRPAGWVLTQHAGVLAYRMTADREIAFKGSQSFRIERVAEQAFGSIAQTVGVSTLSTRASAIRVSAAMRTMGTDEGGWLLSVNTNSRLGILDQIRSEPLLGNQDWRRVSVDVPLTPEVIDVKIAFTLLGAGIGWVDDVRFELVTE